MKELPQYTEVDNVDNVNNKKTWIKYNDYLIHIDKIEIFMKSKNGDYFEIDECVDFQENIFTDNHEIVDNFIYFKDTNVAKYYRFIFEDFIDPDFRRTFDKLMGVKNKTIEKLKERIVCLEDNNGRLKDYQKSSNERLEKVEEMTHNIDKMCTTYSVKIKQMDDYIEKNNMKLDITFLSERLDKVEKGIFKKYKNINNLIEFDDSSIDKYTEIDIFNKIDTLCNQGEKSVKKKNNSINEKLSNLEKNLLFSNNTLTNDKCDDFENVFINKYKNSNMYNIIIDILSYKDIKVLNYILGSFKLFYVESFIVNFTEDHKIDNIMVDILKSFSDPNINCNITKLYLGGFFTYNLERNCVSEWSRNFKPTELIYIISSYLKNFKNICSNIKTLESVIIGIASEPTTYASKSYKNSKYCSYNFPDEVEMKTMFKEANVKFYCYPDLLS